MLQEMPVVSEEEIDFIDETQIREETAALLSADLPELHALFEKQLLSIEQIQETAAAYTENLLVAIQAGNIETAQLEISRLEEALLAWETDAAKMRGATKTAIATLQDELSLRPDLSLTDFSEKWHIEPSLISEEMLVEAPGIVSEIIAYDSDRSTQLTELNNIVAQILDIQKELVIWQTDEIEPLLTAQGNEDEFRTLHEITAAVSEAKNTLSRLESEYAQLREISLNAIGSGVERLLKLGEPKETILHRKATLAKVQSNHHRDWPGEDLATLEKQIQSKIDQHSLARKSARSAQLGQSLRNYWDDTVFIGLLEALAEDENNVTAVLLLLAANNTYPRDGNIQLSGKVAYSLLRGLGQLSQRAKPFELLNLVAGSFLNGWETDDVAAQTELCLVFTAAHYCGQNELPPGILWQLSANWPFENMPNWQLLWQSLLLSEEPITIITQSDTEMSKQEVLDMARRKAEETLTVKDGRFVKVTSLRSDRHRQMLATYVLPNLVAYRDKLRHIEQEWLGADLSRKQVLLKNLQAWVANELSDRLNKAGMTALYEAGVTEHEIHDNHPFHRKSALAFAVNAGQELLNFGQSLLVTWDESQQVTSEVKQTDLAREIDLMSPQTSLGQIALTQIIQDQENPLLSRDNNVTSRQGHNILTRELLTNPAYALSLPHLIGFLTEHPFSWAKLLPYLLEDIAEPLLAQESAQVLLQAQAPWHALLLTKQIDLETQRQSQQIQQELQKRIEELETAVLKLNGHIDSDLQKGKELGRYLFVINSLKLQRDILQAKSLVEIQALQAEGQKLRQTINNLDNALFEIQAEIPNEAFTEIERGFQAARRALRKPASFHAVSEYIEKIEYSLSHRAWPLAGIHEATQRLTDKLADADAKEPDKPKLSVTEVLEHFRDNNLQLLGLDPEYVPSSQVDTRIRVLEDWLAMKKISSFLTANMNSKQVNHIRHFFRYFSRMTSLKQRFTPQGQPLEINDPTILQHMDLKYPRIKPLKERRLILITLPGDPPSAYDITLLENTIVEREWLETARKSEHAIASINYAFVVIFVPNCTDDIKKRLQRNFANSGLIVIDETALLDMCLALKASQTAIGRLRPLLLNSLDIQDISIFQVNQALHPTTSIFVGRQNLITRVANSHDNYAIYGGRRIGKTSVLLAIKERLDAQDVFTVFYSFEGTNASDKNTARNLAERLKLGDTAETVDDFKLKVQKKLDENPDLHIMLLLDEVDRYIVDNPQRHKIIESMRDLSDQNSGRFRVVIAGFMEFFNCLRGRGPYSPSSDPWRRMLNDSGPLGNLRAENAEEIVREGFLNILGWEFEHPMIPERIVLHTGGHPAFVQGFCAQVQDLLGKRKGRVIKLEDLENVVANTDRDHSFIAHVRQTLGLNLGPIERFLIVWLASFYNEATTFTRDEIDEVFESTGEEIPPTHLYRALERLEVTSVIKAKAEGLFEFTVPDYPNILYRLGDTEHLDNLESQLIDHLAKIKAEEM